jgi:hypothetical protein
MLSLEHHPEFERLVQWQDGGLSALEAAEVAGHIAGCGFCSHRADQLAGLARVFRGGLWQRPTDQSRAAVFKAFVQAYAPRRPRSQIVPRLTYDSRTMRPLPGVRADTYGSQQLLYTSADADVTISLRAQDEERWSLIGQVLLTETTLRQPAEVLVVAHDQVVAQTTTTELGGFAMYGVAPGRYRIVVLLPHMRLEIPEVALLP